jgi:glutamate-1-semialdehyde aminotransferase
MVDPRFTELKNRLGKVIAQGCLTNSKHPSCFVEGVYPIIAKAGLGPFLECEDGKNYIDTICGLGSVSIGYRRTEIDKAVIAQIMNNGRSFSLPTVHEIEAAEYLLYHYLPSYDAVKWLKTGAEATSAAARIARAATGRKVVLQVGYHGWHDQWISTKNNPQGLPSKDMAVDESMDLEDAMLAIDEKHYAAAIIEPIMLEHSEENTKKLFQLQEVCARNGTLLIFDEIVCGMRIPEGFISSVVHPDLVCIGKGIANGSSVSGVVGPKALMHELPYFVSSTFAGEAADLVGCLATLKTWKNCQFEDVYAKANQTMQWINEGLKEFHVKLEGYGTRGYWKGDLEKIALVFQEAIKCQILLGRSFFYNVAMRESDEVLRSRFSDVFLRLKNPALALEGLVPREPFKRV